MQKHLYTSGSLKSFPEQTIQLEINLYAYTLYEYFETKERTVKFCEARREIEKRTQQHAFKAPTMTASTAAAYRYEILSVYDLSQRARINRKEN